MDILLPSIQSSFNDKQIFFYKTKIVYNNFLRANESG